MGPVSAADGIPASGFLKCPPPFHLMTSAYDATVLMEVSSNVCVRVKDERTDFKAMAMCAQRRRIAPRLTET